MACLLRLPAIRRVVAASSEDNAQVVEGMSDG
jgi:hypothetical protein